MSGNEWVAHFRPNFSDIAKMLGQKIATFVYTQAQEFNNFPTRIDIVPSFWVLLNPRSFLPFIKIKCLF